VAGTVFFLIFGLGFVLLMMILWLVPVRLWIAARAAGVPVTILSLIGMRLRRVPPHRIVDPQITAVKAGLNISSNTLEAHYLAGGNVQRVVNALISADKANIPLTFEKAAAIDLAGRDVLEAVHMSVKPIVIDCPRPSTGQTVVAAVAMDGIQVKAKARVTVRANLDRLVGGA
jgi:uncharacterized protein YqfA (UPF0365 family)